MEFFWLEMQKKKYHNYLKEHWKKGHSLDFLRQWSIKNGLHKDFVHKEVDNFHTKHKLKVHIPAVAIFVLLIVLANVLIFYTGIGPTGMAVYQDVEYSDSVNLEFTSNGEYTWTPAPLGNIRRIGITGEYDSYSVVRLGDTVILNSSVFDISEELISEFDDIKLDYVSDEFSSGEGVVTKVIK